MLMIDDNMYKLSRMQESLLKVTNDDVNLNNYVNTVTEIDHKAFDALINMMKDFDKYNQTLEDELIYLEKIKEAYNQLSETQMRFKSVCEQYGKNDLKLSDMSQLNIEYIENRINAINGYLINIKNIDKNKKRIEVLNEQLIDEEKKRDYLNKKILILEKNIKDDFVRASLKQVVFGKLETFSIISEYERLGYNVLSLLQNTDDLNNSFRVVNAQLEELTEKYEIAKVCHSNLLNADSRYIMDEIEKEFYTTKYKYVMLNILKLLANEVETYEFAKEKREKFIELIDERNICLEKLGINNPLNVLNFMNIDDQLKEIDTLKDTIKTIHKIRKEIADLTVMTEEMINQNNSYLISLSETKELINSEVGMNDIDITTFDDIVVEEVRSKEVVLSNQVVKVKSLSPSFKLNIAKQKANGVIERICKINIKDNNKKTKEEYSPELVIGPKEQLGKTKNDVLDTVVFSDEVEDIETNIEVTEEVIDNNEVIDTSVLESANGIEKIEILEPTLVETVMENNNDVFVDNSEVILNPIENSIDDKPLVEESISTDIFETTTPFDAPVLFTDRTDSEPLMPESMNIIAAPTDVVIEQEEKPEVNVVTENQEEAVLMPEIATLSQGTDTSLTDSTNEETMMPDAFWITDETDVNKDDEPKTELSFEEQINALLAENNNEPIIRKR